MKRILLFGHVYVLIPDLEYVDEEAPQRFSAEAGGCKVTVVIPTGETKGGDSRFTVVFGEGFLADGTADEIWQEFFAADQVG